MMKTLEVGTQHRTTATTRMNQSSSRSHAIFTVFIEHTIYASHLLSPDELDRPSSAGVDARSTEGPRIGGDEGEINSTAALTVQNAPARPQTNKEVNKTYPLYPYPRFHRIGI